MTDQDLWEFWVDRGGTFTDIVARPPGGGDLRVLKLLSEHPERYDDAVVEGVRRFLGVAPGAPTPAHQIAAIKLGTTVATNALLERRGAKTAFLTTHGFADTPVLGDQSRPDIFALHIERPAPLHMAVGEVDGRMNAWGDELRPLNVDAARATLETLRAAGADALAICLLHAAVNPDHERILSDLAEDYDFAHIAVSSTLDPLVKFIPRARTTLADAYLTPVLRSYIQGLSEALAGAPLYFMTSSGGLTTAETFTGRDALLSGPAGGVVGMAKTAQSAGYSKVIGFDMGGTSTDVSRFDGEDFERVTSAVVGDWPVRAPQMAVHTVAAGGGSVLQFDGERALAGPESAGADPGPAAYGAGGPLTVTDANIILGRLDARYFPNVLGPGGDRPLNVDHARKRFAALAYDMGADTVEAAAEGFLTVAVENMAQAVKKISAAQGFNPSDYALASFGGAGGQAACRVADALDVKTVLIHPMASVLSALGIGLADLRAWREAAFARPLTAAAAQEARTRSDALATEVRQILARQAPGAHAQCRGEALVRYSGADAILPVPLGSAAEMRAALDAAHRRLFGFAEADADAEFVSLSVHGRSDPPGSTNAAVTIAPSRGGPAPRDLTHMIEAGQPAPCPVYALEDLGAGATVHGPCLIVEPNNQIVVERGWRGERRSDAMLVLTRFAARAEDAGSTAVDPVRLELFNSRFMAVAEDMGAVLERTARSVNIKERLDFSCAVFDPGGGLVANAPHMPVHLGSMGASVRAVATRFPGLKAGEAVALNTPYEGGTHLPDITVVAPVADRTGGERLFYVAARGHHADIGGTEPGSMPPFSTDIAEEGVAISPMKILSNGEFQDQAVRAILATSAHPARNPDRNVADLKAQLAACMAGEAALQRLVAEHGRDVVTAYMGHVQDNAEAAVRRIIAMMPNGSARMTLDGGGEICVAITVDKETQSAVIDFTGTSDQHGSNFNAPAAVTYAAVLYVFRALAGVDIPLNDGGLKPLDIRIPPESLLDPRPPAAVVAGNVETSQHVVDALFAACGALSASQGTMNNLTFGDARRQYYETIAGGAGAGPAAFGADGVHTHMTNSRLTDPEILEMRYPVLVERHAVRTGSGGDGRHPGGAGVTRRLRFVDAMTVSLLSTRRDTAPPGVGGGAHGAPGRQRLIHSTGAVETLPARFRITVAPGDAVEIETPGAGGWGAPQ